MSTRDGASDHEFNIVDTVDRFNIVDSFDHQFKIVDNRSGLLLAIMYKDGLANGERYYLVYSTDSQLDYHLVPLTGKLVSFTTDICLTDSNSTATSCTERLCTERLVTEQNDGEQLLSRSLKYGLIDLYRQNDYVLQRLYNPTYLDELYRWSLQFTISVEQMKYQPTRYMNSNNVAQYIAYLFGKPINIPFGQYSPVTVEQSPSFQVTSTRLEQSTYNRLTQALARIQLNIPIHQLSYETMSWSTLSTKMGVFLLEFQMINGPDHGMVMWLRTHEVGLYQGVNTFSSSNQISKHQETRPRFHIMDRRRLFDNVMTFRTLNTTYLRRQAFLQSFFGYSIADDLDCNPNIDFPLEIDCIQIY